MPILIAQLLQAGLGPVRLLKKTLIWKKSKQNRCTESMGWREAAELGKIMLNNGYYAVQGHSMSPLSVQSKAYATFY